ncbi:MAG: hypothetical protein GF398_04215 [Chitinivibrionales bacterium]|nr:hypothetical protein [Chitinivibrionales bacterium]
MISNNPGIREHNLQHNNDTKDNNKDRNRQHGERRGFGSGVARSEKRRLRGLQRKRHPLWFGFGYFGVVGWMVMIPLIACGALGIWLDSQTRGEISWTLTFLFIGLGIGLSNAWFWVSRQRKEIEEERQE